MQSLPPIKYSYTAHGVVSIICLKATKLTNPPRLLPAYRFVVCLLVCVNSLCQWEDRVFWDHNPCWWYGSKHILFPRYAQAARTAVMCNSSVFRGSILWPTSYWMSTSNMEIFQVTLAPRLHLMQRIRIFTQGSFQSEITFLWERNNYQYVHSHNLAIFQAYWSFSKNETGEVSSLTQYFLPNTPNKTVVDLWFYPNLSQRKVFTGLQMLASYRQNKMTNTVQKNVDTANYNPIQNLPKFWTKMGTKLLFQLYTNIKNI